MTTTDQTAPRTVRFGRRSTRGVLLGLSGPRVAAVGLAFLIVVPSVYLAGLSGVVLTSPVWGVALAAAFVSVAGRRAVEWVPVYGQWLVRRVLHQDEYRVRVSRPRPVGTLALPGDAACLRVHVDAVGGAAMVHDPYAHTLTAAARVRHPSFALQAAGDQDRRVSGWSRVLATACASGRLARIQVLERTLPDSGTGVRAHWDEHGAGPDSWAGEQYESLLEDAAPTTERHETYVAVSLDMSRARRAIRAEGGGVRGGAVVLRRELGTIASALRAAEVAPDGWAGPEELATILRSAYDPTTRLDERPTGRDLATAGPVAVHEHLDYLRTDSGVHAVYWISEWPRAEVHPGFLSPLLLAAGVRRTTSIVAQPLTTAEAMRAVRKSRVEYQTDVAHRERIGQLSDAGADQEWADVSQRERDLVAGHGDLRYAGFVVVTAPDLEALDAARASVEQAAIQAGCETRLLLGQQAQAFAAAALPLCQGI